jgi:hypothetical protein
MPDDKPSSAPDTLQPSDELSAAAVLNDDAKSPGGGALLGGNADTAPSTGGNAPNAAVDVPTPAAGRAGAAEGESVAAAGEDAPEPRPVSQ